MPASRFRQVPLSEIQIGTRHRKAVGDLTPLIISISDIGLLQPVVLTADHRLVAGFRRIEAFKVLGRDAIPAVIARDLTEAVDLLKAERDENTCRLPFTPSEAVRIGEVIAATYRPKAQAAQQASTSKAGKASVEKRNGNAGKTFPRVGRDESKRTAAVAAMAAGMSRPTFEKATAVVNSGDDDLIAEMDRTGRVDGVYRKLKRATAAEQIAAEPPPMPTGPFRVIVVDPPWQYDERAEDPTHRAACPYPCMSVDEIKSLSVAKLAHDDAILWLWTTNAFMVEAHEIAQAWGFAVKTILSWFKDRMGTGDWLRGQTEHCLLCVRGRPTILLANQTTALEAPAGKHSEKPEAFYRLVEGLCPGRSKVELFARREREGWARHGNELNAPITCPNCGGHDIDEEGDCRRCLEPNITSKP